MIYQTKHELHFKDASPLDTVTKLKTILKNLEIETDELWQEESSIGTFSLRVQFKGTSIGCNGKGVTKEFALASAYAELFERYQNNYLSTSYDKNDEFYFETSSDEKILSSVDIVKENSSFINYYFSKLNLENATVTEKAYFLNNLHRIDYFTKGWEDGYISLPFYSVNEQKVKYLPKNIYMLIYGSNGMSAGNTPEEALVQGLSEIIERVIQKRIMLERPSLPDIPDNYISRYPYIYEIYKKLQRHKGYEYKLKDCSFGGKYPVAGLLILEKNTGRYGIKLGSHPNFGIAMERAFTEATQGQDIFKYVERSRVDFFNCNVDTDMNICNSFKTGLAQYPYQVILGKQPAYPFVEVKDILNLDNKQILKNWISELQSDGYDILIRDVSNLGFPSYHIVVPGLSEINEISVDKFKIYNTKFYASSLIMNVNNVNKSNCKYIIAILKYFSNSIYENNLSSYFTRFIGKQLPGESIQCTSDYLEAMCYVLLEDYEKAAKKILMIYRRVELIGVDKEELNTYLAMFYYFSAMSVIKDSKEVLNYIDFMFDKPIYNKIKHLFEEPSNILKIQYPVIDKNLKDGEYKYFAQNLKKLKKMQLDNPVSQEQLNSLFN